MQACYLIVFFARVYKGCTKLRLAGLGHKILVVFESILMGFGLFSWIYTPLKRSLLFLHRRIVAARRSVHSLLRLLALGGFASQKTILNCFFLATFNYAGVLFDRAFCFDPYSLPHKAGKVKKRLAKKSVLCILIAVRVLTRAAILRLCPKANGIIFPQSDMLPS